MHAEAANLNTVAACDGLNKGSFANYFDKLFAGEPVLVEVSNLAGCHGVGEGKRDGVLSRTFVSMEGWQGWTRKERQGGGTDVNSLEPDCYMGYECNADI